MRKILLLLVLALMCCPMGQAEEWTLEQRTYPLAQNVELVKLLGRSYVTENGISCDCAATGIEFDAYFAGPMTIEVVNVIANANVYFTVYVDGERLEERFLAQTGDRTVFTIPDLGEAEYRTIKIAKQTDPSRGYCELASITLNGELVGPAWDNEYYIEFIGDSLTSGYGNLIHGMPTDGSGPGGSINTDGTQSYAAIACDTIGADYSLVSFSGIGLREGWADCTVRDFYTARAFMRDDTPFDFAAARVPNAVVVNIGTNDQNAMDDGRGTREGFAEGVRELVATIRGAYGPDMPILWIYGMNGLACSDVTSAVFEELGGEEAGLYMLEFPFDNNGGNNHPDLDAHYICAEILTFRLYDILDQ